MPCGRGFVTKRDTVDRDADIRVFDSAYDVDESSRQRHVVVTGSYAGVLPARFVARFNPLGAVGIDCGMAMHGSGVAGLWYYEALGIPGVAADVMTVELGNGGDVLESGAVSAANYPAVQVGVSLGISIREAARLMLHGRVEPTAPNDVTNRHIVWTSSAGRSIVCTDSIAFALPDDHRRNVICCAGHAGVSSVPYVLRAQPLGYICSDGGRGKNDAGVAGLKLTGDAGIAGAAVDAMTARMGDGLSTYADGVISETNLVARSLGVRPGQTAMQAARLIIESAPSD
jgi:hypothetical protein